VRLSIGDFGIGIPENVRMAKGPGIPAANALKWAFLNGSSTLQGDGDVARGLGLSTVKDLIVANKGKLEMFSNDGYFLIDAKASVPEVYRSRINTFQGTIVTIELHCDSLLYCFDYEAARPKPRRRSVRR
jgi:hypothetical protein